MKFRTRYYLYFSLVGITSPLLFFFIPRLLELFRIKLSTSTGDVLWISIIIEMAFAIGLAHICFHAGLIRLKELKSNLDKVAAGKESTVKDTGAGAGKDEFRELQRFFFELKQKSQQEQAVLQDKFEKLLSSYTVLEEKYAQSYTVQLILEEISRELDTDQLLKKTTDIVMGVFGSNGCTIYMVDEPRESLMATASSGSFGETGHRKQLSLSSNSIAARAWRNRRVYTEADLKAREIAELKARNTSSVLALPLTGRRGCVGVLLIEHKTVGKFKPEVIEFAKLIAQEVSLSVENSYLYCKMREMATHDALTGIYNRMYLINYFVDLFSSQPGTVSVIIFDMDFFKKVNDQFGHLAGDLVLRTTTALIQKMLPAGILARYGGEEFVVVLPEMNQEEAFQFADQMRAKIAEYQYISADGARIPVTLSAGLANYPLMADNHEGLLKLADEALYEAKKTGRNKVCVATTGQSSIKATL